MKEEGTIDRIHGGRGRGCRGRGREKGYKNIKV